MTATALERLELIRANADQDAFPKRVFEGAETALVLFASGFYGQQDAIFVADAGVRATCVDMDELRLAAMSRFYPEDWQFVAANVYDFVPGVLVRYDVVTVDCPSGHFDRCADLVSSFCGVASKAVVLGSGVSTVVLAPTGWQVTETMKRTDYGGGVFWSVLEPV